MTKVANEHVTANKALIEVQLILAKVGALSEVINNDYGEDLLIQTNLKEIVDNFYLLIQVKGRNLKANKSKKYPVKFEVGHMYRWISHIQSVLVCVYDEPTKKIFAFSPKDSFSLWELSTATKQTITINLADDDIFDEDSARKFIWKSRIDYCSRMLSYYESNYNYLENDVDGKEQKMSLMNEGNIIVLNLLKAFGVVISDGIGKVFTDKVEIVSKNLAKINSDEKAELTIKEVFIMCLLGSVDDIESGVGLPTNLVSHGANLAEHFFKMTNPAAWEAAHNRLAPEKQIKVVS